MQCRSSGMPLINALTSSIALTTTSMRLAVEATDLTPCFDGFAPNCHDGSFSPCDATWNIVNASSNKPIKHLCQGVEDRE
ncbi:hypothetical protein QYF36_022461 [Acer negundo]|nr:hypothetical protein QYF36_022461 [Acer negundo]